jgi:hypothetical protein
MDTDAWRSYMKPRARRIRFWFAIFFCFVPLILCFAYNREYWPFTHFPMYSQSAKRIFWTQIRVWPKGASPDDPGRAVLAWDCFRPFGPVRFHFSLLKWAMAPNRSSVEERKINALVEALAKEWTRTSRDPHCLADEIGEVQAYVVLFETSEYGAWDIANPKSMQVISDRHPVADGDRP